MPKWWHLEQYNNETGYNVIFNFYHHKVTFLLQFSPRLSLLNILKYLSVKELCRCASVRQTKCDLSAQNKSYVAIFTCGV